MTHTCVAMTSSHVPMIHINVPMTHVHVSRQALVGGLAVLIRLVVGLAGPQLLPGRAGDHGERPVHGAQLQLPHAVPVPVQFHRTGRLRITEAVAAGDESSKGQARPIRNRIAASSTASMPGEAGVNQAVASLVAILPLFYVCKPSGTKRNNNNANKMPLAPKSMPPTELPESSRCISANGFRLK